MADIIDLANDRADEILEDALRKKKPEGPKPNGKCHNCEEPVPVDHKFCDRDCRDDWEVRNDRQQKQFADGVAKDVDDYEF